MKPDYCCSTKFCRKEPSLKFNGKWLCNDCWEKKCEVDMHATVK